TVTCQSLIGIGSTNANNTLISAGHDRIFTIRFRKEPGGVLALPSKLTAFVTGSHDHYNPLGDCISNDGIVKSHGLLLDVRILQAGAKAHRNDIDSLIYRIAYSLFYGLK